MGFVFVVDFIYGFLNVEAFIYDGKYFSETERVDEQLSISLFDGIVFRLELQIDFCFFLDVEKVGCNHFSEGIDCFKHLVTLDTGTMFEYEELTGVIVGDLIQSDSLFDGMVKKE
jgi:hypothetical protein